MTPEDMLNLRNTIEAALKEKLEIEVTDTGVNMAEPAADFDFIWQNKRFNLNISLTGE